MRGASADAAGFSVPRCSQYLGRWIRHGTWYPDRSVRLFDRRHGRFEPKATYDLHERVVLDGPTASLAGELPHVPYRSISEHLQTIDRYTTIMAEGLNARGVRAGVSDLVLHPAWRFFQFYVLKAGFLDGWRGLLLAYSRGATTSGSATPSCWRAPARRRRARRRMTSLAVIVSTYNNPRALNLVLAGLERQTRPPQEVLIADDGSGAETAALIESWAQPAPVSAAPRLASRRGVPEVPHPEPGHPRRHRRVSGLLRRRLRAGRALSRGARRRARRSIATSAAARCCWGRRSAPRLDEAAVRERRPRSPRPLVAGRGEDTPARR